MAHRTRKEDRQSIHGENKILELYCSGMEYIHIQNRCGINKNSIKGYVAKYGYPLRPKGQWHCCPDKVRKEWITEAKAFHAARVAGLMGGIERKDAATHI